MSDGWLKDKLQAAGFLNAPSPYLAMGSLENFRRLLAHIEPIDMILFCPMCGVQHVDAPEHHDVVVGEEDRIAVDTMTGLDNPPHKSHLCHECGCIWRPADVCTNGVASILTRGERDNFKHTRMMAMIGDPAMTPPEALASRMIDAWCAAHGKQIPWAKAVQITAIITKMDQAECARLIALGDTP